MKGLLRSPVRERVSTQPELLQNVGRGHAGSHVQLDGSEVCRLAETPACQASSDLRASTPLLDRDGDPGLGP